MHASQPGTTPQRSSPGALNANDSLNPGQRALVKKLKPLLYAALLAVLVVVFIARAGFAAPPPSFKGVVYDGKPFFVHGVNMPWIRWGCDFGSACNIRETEGEIRKAFADFRASNLNVVRWWLFPGNPVTYPAYGGNVVTLVDGAGKPLDFHPDVYADMAYVLDLAREYDLKLNFTIYSSHMDLPTSWKENPEHRQALADLLGRLAGRFAGRPEVFAWELFNEPEAGLGTPEDSNPYARNIKELTRLVIAAQRQAMAGSSPRALINLGPDRVKPAHFAFWKGLDVDFWSPHYYDNMTGDTNALATTADEIRARHGITQPILLGELYLGRGVPPPNNFVPQSVNLDPLARYEDVLARGYAGAWGWAYRPQNDRLTVDLAAAKAFADRYPGLIGPRGNAAGTPPPAAPPSTPTSPPPAATPTPPPAPTAPPPGLSDLPEEPPPAEPPPAEPPPAQPGTPADAAPIFIDELAPGWTTRHTWGGSAETVGGAGVGGSAGVRFSCNAGWCGLRFTPATGSALSPGTKLSFHHRGAGGPGTTYKVFVNGGAGLHVLGYFTTGAEWQQAQFDVGDATLMMDELVFQEHHGKGANTIVVDNLAIAGPGLVVAPPDAQPQPVEPQPEQPVEPQPVEPQPEPAPARHEVFTDSLSPEWMDQSWSGFSASIGGGPDGSTAYQFACQAGWCAVRFVHPTGVALGEGGSLSFSHRRHGEVNATYKVWVVDGGRTMHVLGYVTPGPDWAEARFDLGAIGNVNTVVLQEHHGGSGGIILLDNLRFN